MTNTSKSQPDSLSGWLSYLEHIHPSNIDMGLERVQAVYQKLNIDLTHSQVILVAGTNGKGSTCRLVEVLAQRAGLTTAVYSSPHITDYRERVRINGDMLSEMQHCDAFQRVEDLREDTSLTYFEYGTLAALCLIADARPDVVLLEVGLGGRLDAVNIVTPDISVITTIDLDHQDWLGDTREAVAVEKAGIMRRNTPCVVGELNPPATLKSAASNIEAQVYWQTQQFGFELKQSSGNLSSGSWQYYWYVNDERTTLNLPVPNLPMQNCATAITVARLSGWVLDDESVASVIATTTLPGRFEKLLSTPDFIVDVAHNPEATTLLASRIDSLTYKQLHFVLGMLSDKDSRRSLAQLRHFNANWYLSPLNTPRSAKAEMLESALGDCNEVKCFKNIQTACESVLKIAEPGDLIVGFGSFFTVSEIKQALHNI